jgi:hypothetical protein
MAFTDNHTRRKASATTPVSSSAFATRAVVDTYFFNALMIGRNRWRL